MPGIPLVRIESSPILLAVTALFAMMVLTFFDVVLRSAVDRPIEAATELTRILMAVVVFSALPVVSGRGEHISVDLLDRVFTYRLSEDKGGDGGTVKSDLTGVYPYPTEDLTALRGLCQSPDAKYRLVAVERLLAHPGMDPAAAEAMKTDPDGNVRDAAHRFLDGGTERP